MASGSWWDWAPTLLQVGTTIWGASQQANATQAAAQTAANAQNAATQAQLDIYNKQQAAASPGLTQMQNIINRGDALTQDQTNSIDKARRTTLDSLRGSGLRGSARATISTVKGVEGDMTNQYLTSNQNRVDSAASGLANQAFASGNNAANAVSSGLTSVGDINASSQLGTANTTGKAIGDIGAIIADEIKNNQKRDSSYGDTAKGV